jgi:hypothetical protein
MTTMLKMRGLSLFILLVLTFACAQNRPYGKAGAGELAGTPGWVYKTSFNSDKVCAVGTCGLTFNLEDAKPCAADNAREALSKSVSVEVKSIMLDVSENDRQSIDSAGVSSVSGYTSETVLNESIIEEYWFDADGRVSQGVTFALACIPKNKAPQNK